MEWTKDSGFDESAKGMALECLQADYAALKADPRHRLHDYFHVAGKWVAETSGNPLPGFNKKHHWQLDGNARCLTHLRFARTGIKLGQEKLQPGSTKEGIPKVMAVARKSKSATVAVNVGRRDE